MNRSSNSFSPNVRLLMRQIRAIMAGSASAQERLDAFARVIGASLIADVCSIYLRRAGGSLELCATEGLAPSAVHKTTMRPDEGLVGRVARTARPLNVRDAPNHPAFSFHPETEEEGVVSFLGVPILRGGRLLGVLTIQNRTQRRYDDEELETLQTAAMIIAEVLTDPELAVGTAFAGIEVRPSEPERVIGKPVTEGVAIGKALKHEQHVPAAKLIADDPEREVQRLGAAVDRLRTAVDALLNRRMEELEDQSRDVLETFRMIAHDRGWLDQLQEAARSGLTAEAAVERVQNQHRARMLTSRDDYLRDRMHDLDDLANRLLRHLSEDGGAMTVRAPRVEDPIVFARSMGPAELLDRAQEGLRGLVLEEGSANSHAAIVARALGIPVVGRVFGALERVENGDEIVIDGTLGEVHIRPPAVVLEAYAEKIASRGRARAAFARLKDVPTITKCGRRLSLFLNAGLEVDLPQLERTGADGIGLFRTEFQFMIADAMPRMSAQRALYSAALDAAGERPVIFRTLDLGGDKILPYVDAEHEENPAMGWRAVRMALDRPGLMRYQLRALIQSAHGRDLHIMFPLVATPKEFVDARALVDFELEKMAAKGRAKPASVRVGAMVETPAIVMQIDQLLAHADFVSVGANDLFQFTFAVDRGNSRLGDRYDFLSPPMLRMLRMIAEAANRAGKPASVCGEVSGRPLEAMTLVALGFNQLSMPAAGMGPVKRMALALDATGAREAVCALEHAPEPSVRTALIEIAKKQKLSI